MNLIRVENLTKKYDDVIAVNNISFNVDKGDILGIVGPNGAGKSTTINTIAGLLVPNEGNIKFEENSTFKTWHTNIGLVPQDLAIYPDLSAEENVTFFASLYGLKHDLLKQRVDEALRSVGLEEHRKKRVDKFSGGMKRRLNIACAIVHKPKLIIMDEPTVGIDPQSRNYILDSIKEFRQNGTTIIYTSHYMEEVEEICNRVLIIDHGEIILSGITENIKSKFNSEKIIAITTKTPVTNTEQLEKELLAISEINSIILKGSGITLYCKKSTFDYSIIFNVLKKFDISITDIESKTPSLEEIFLTLTGKELRD